MNSSVLKTLVGCPEKQTLLEVASIEKRCSKCQKLLKGCRAQSGHA